MTDDTRADLPAPKDLNASSALIVGGTAGIGLASARALAAAGVPRIVVVGRNAERGPLAVKSIAGLGGSAHFLAGGAAHAAPRLVVLARTAERGQLAVKSIAELGASAPFIAGDAADPAAAAAVA